MSLSALVPQAAVEAAAAAVAQTALGLQHYGASSSDYTTDIGALIEAALPHIAVETLIGVNTSSAVQHAGLSAIVERQSEYDGETLVPHDILVPAAIIEARHVQHHLTKSLAKLAGFVEQAEHGATPDPRDVTDKVIPELLISAFRLARILDVDPFEMFEKREVDNMARKAVP